MHAESRGWSAWADSEAPRQAVLPRGWPFAVFRRLLAVYPCQ